jgi:hypothetical protein
MNKYFIILSLFLNLNSLGQNVVLNGDFENNTSPGCSFNLLNSTFNNMISDCFAFGLSNEIDIQDTTCFSGPYPGADPQRGLWFISIATHTQVAGNYSDALSMTLSNTLYAGTSYFLSYFEKADTSFGNHTIDSVIFGISNDSSQFGTQISASLPNQVQWNHRRFQIIIPVQGKYLTLSNKGYQYGWSFIDGVCLAKDSSTCFIIDDEADLNDEGACGIFPNPFNSELNIRSPFDEPLNIFLYDLEGRLLISKSFKTSITLNTEQLSKGLYIYILKNENRVVKVGKLIKD